MTIRVITIRTGYTFGAVFRIIHNALHVGMRRICASWIPHMIDIKRPGMLQTAIIHHDNAPSRIAAHTTETLKRLGFGLIDHHPYSLALAPCDFFLFLLIKSVLKGTRFEDVADLQLVIDEIPVNSYRECFLSWVKRCRKCVDYKGHYFKRE